MGNGLPDCSPTVSDRQIVCALINSEAKTISKGRDGIDNTASAAQVHVFICNRESYPRSPLRNLTALWTGRR